MSRLHGAQRSPHVCAVQSGHVRVSPAWREALSARMCGAERTRLSCLHSAKRSLHVCAARGGHVRVSPAWREALSARSGTGWRRACPTSIAQSALRTYVRCRADTQSALRTYVWCRADTCVSRRRYDGAKRCHHVCASQGGHGCLACIARSAFRTYVRRRADTGMSRLHNAKGYPHVCAVQGGHVGVPPA